MSQSPVPDSGRSEPDVFAPIEPRRGFVAQLTAIAIGGLVGVFPAAVGLATFLNPLRKSAKEKQIPVGSDVDGYYRVTTLDSLSGIPQAFKIIADRKDAWNTFPKDAIGAVFLSRAGSGDVRAFNVTCPHAGCAVDYKAGKQAYHCPCHNSSFDPDGVRDPKSPSARNLDSLPVKISDDGAVWVKYQDFKTGDKDKKPV
jgi:menaquinol-cytochrome c reductase iron-sulfur subunit